MGYKDQSGKVVINAQFDDAKKFSQGIAKVTDKSKGAVAYIDTTGKLVIPYKYGGGREWSFTELYDYSGKLIKRLDENISNAMSQIGVQLSSRFDALSALLDLTKGYAKQGSETLIETIKSRRSIITAKSTPDDVLCQEGIITEALGRIAMVTEQYSDLKANQTYIKTMDAVQTFENMVRLIRLIDGDTI